MTLVNANDLASGMYSVRVRQFSGTAVRGEANKAPPMFMLQPYTLEAIQ